MLVKVERVAWAAANVSMTTVSWLVVIVTLARYCAICRPLDTLQIGRSKRVRKVRIFLYLAIQLVFALILVLVHMLPH